MEYEATLLDGTVSFMEADSPEAACRQADKPVVTLRVLIEADGYEWVEVYQRKYVDVVAYVNAWENGEPVASVPISVRLESYQSIKAVGSVANERQRLLAIWPNAVIKVQKHYLR